MPLIVGLTGAPGAGKDTVAALLADQHGLWRHSFAARLKRFACDTDEKLNKLVELHGSVEAAKRADPYVRERLNEIGASARRHISPDVWCWPVEQEIKRWVQHTRRSVVISDVRYENEVGMISRLGGSLVVVERPGYEPENARIEELCQAAELTVLNDGGLVELETRVEMLVSRLDREQWWL